MRERIVLLACLGGTFLVTGLAVYFAYSRNLAILEERSRAEDLRDDLRHSMAKSLELSRQLSELAQETSTREFSTSSQKAAYQSLEGRIAQLVQQLSAENGASLGSEIEELKTSLGALKEALDTGLTATQSEIQALTQKQDEIAARLAKVVSSGAELESRQDALAELIQKDSNASLEQLKARFDQHQALLVGLRKKVEILGKLFATTDVSSQEREHDQTVTVKARIVAVDNENIALSTESNISLQTTSLVHVTRDGTLIAKAKVFSVDSKRGYAAATVLSLEDGKTIRVGDTATVQTNPSHASRTTPTANTAPTTDDERKNVDDAPKPSETTPPLLRSRPPPPPAKPLSQPAPSST